MPQYFKNNSESIELYDILLKCLQDNPDDRPTAATVLSLLEKQMTTDVPNSFKYGMFNVNYGNTAKFDKKYCLSSISSYLATY